MEAAQLLFFSNMIYRDLKYVKQLRILYIDTM